MTTVLPIVNIRYADNKLVVASSHKYLESRLKIVTKECCMKINVKNKGHVHISKR